MNLYGFVGNDGVNRWDYLGFESHLQRTERLKREAKEREEKERATPPEIQPYVGPKELWVKLSDGIAAREYFGYSMALEAVRLTLRTQERANQKEYGGRICSKCIDCSDGSKRLHIMITGPTRGHNDQYNSIANSSKNDAGTKIYHDICPEGYEAIAGYHSHTLQVGGDATSVNPSRQDGSRFLPTSRKEYLNQHYAESVAGDSIVSGRQMVDRGDPEFVGGVKNPGIQVCGDCPKVATAFLPSLQEDQIIIHAPNTYARKNLYFIPYCVFSFLGMYGRLSRIPKR